MRRVWVPVCTTALLVGACRTASPPPPPQRVVTVAGAVSPPVAAAVTVSGSVAEMHQAALRLIGQGDLAGAEALLAAAATLPGGGTDAEVWNDLSYVQARRERFADAVGSARRALALKPDFPYAQYNLGWSLLGTPAWAQARAPLEATMQAQPGRPEPLWALGRWHERSGEREAAAGYRRRAAAMGYMPARIDQGFVEMVEDLRAAGHAVDGAQTDRAVVHMGGDDRPDLALVWPGGVALYPAGGAVAVLTVGAGLVPNLAPHGVGMVVSGGRRFLAAAFHAGAGSGGSGSGSGEAGQVIVLAYEDGALREVFRGKGEGAGIDGNDLYTYVRLPGEFGAMVTLYAWDPTRQTFQPARTFRT